MKLGSVAALGAALVAALGALFLASSARAETFPASCPVAPPDATSSTDAAIEVRELRQELSAMCDVLALRSDAALARSDLGWQGAWAAVGVLFALIVAPMMQRAFRWWRE